MVLVDLIKIERRVAEIIQATQAKEIERLEAQVKELEKDRNTLLRALKTIAEKETCKELNPESDKYKNYQEGWEGVALFAQKTIAVRKLID